MKKLIFIPFVALIGVLFLQGKSAPETTTLATDAALPANVKAVVDQKCYGCHNVNSKNEKAKTKLDWDAFEKLKKSKRMAAMEKISEVLAEGKMPPEKFLANKPEAKLSESDLVTLKEWSAGKKKK